jgi:hypothetical protein
MTRNFSKVTAAVLATLTISAAAVSFTTENASAGGRGERMGMGRMGHSHNMGHMGHRGGHGYRHGGHGFGRGFGVGMAAVVIGGAIIAANEHREMVARIRYDQAVRTAAKKRPVVIAKKTRECEVVAALETLLKSAEETLETDKRMNAQYGEDVRDAKGNVVRTNHSGDHAAFQEQEVQRLREQLRKAKEACKPPAG